MYMKLWLFNDMHPLNPPILFLIEKKYHKINLAVMMINTEVQKKL